MSRPALHDGRPVISEVRATAFGLGGVAAAVLLAVLVRRPVDVTGFGPTPGENLARALAAAEKVADKPGRTSLTSSSPASVAGAKASSPTTAPAETFTPPSADSAAAELLTVARARQYKKMRVAIEAVAKEDPDAARNAEVRDAIVRVAMDSLVGQGPFLSQSDIDAIFLTVGTGFGTIGPDILLELVMTRGGSMGSKRAEKELANPAVREKGSPAMRVAYELRAARASCESRRPFFERAQKDGDRRAWKYLEDLRDVCSDKREPCCAELHTALDEFKARGVR